VRLSLARMEKRKKLKSNDRKENNIFIYIFFVIDKHLKLLDEKINDYKLGALEILISRPYIPDLILIKSTV
jgi:hypothetical protein